MSTGIEWTDETWNPTTGCDRISKGCDNCYALTMAARLKGMGQAKYQTDGDPRTSGPGFGLAVHDDALTIPYRWRKPRVVFVNSMSDLFHARVPRAFIRRVFDVMADTPQHTYQVLTKRSTRLRRMAGELEWPPNVWMGVSVEDADQLHRIDDLRTVPAAVRFLSLEPLLGPLGDIDLTGIHWAITGGESGAGARPIHPDWVRSIRDQCQTTGTAFFFKQWGAWAPTGQVGIGCTSNLERLVGEPDEHGFRQVIRRVGKKDAGRELDGRTWDEMPALVAAGRAS